MEDALVHLHNMAQLISIVQVLILVVMEDALVLKSFGLSLQGTKVLILVVMEDALVHFVKEVKSILTNCLNPCCNGRCTRTILDSTRRKSHGKS